MKINNSNIHALHINSYKSNEGLLDKTRESVGKDKIKDTCELSSVGKELNKLAVEDETFGVSEKKVMEIKEKITKGTYEVDTTLLAKKLIEKMKGGQ